jgi:hypothetical protein
MVYLQGVTDPDEREILKIGLPLLISANEQPPEGKPKITDKQRATAHAELARGMRPESEASRKNKSLQELLSREDVQRELAKDNPDFNSNALKGCAIRSEIKHRCASNGWHSGFGNFQKSAL